MKKLKAIFAGLVLACVAAPVAAGEFSFTDYGAGIKGGDKTLTIDAALPWTYFGLLGSGYFYTPTVYADLDFAVPLGSIGLPFTFGGWASANIGIGKNYFATNLVVGGAAGYHVRLPVDNLDLYAMLRLGVNVTLYNGLHFGFHPEFNIGASYFFSETFGINAELGYPGFKAGVIFKF